MSVMGVLKFQGYFVLLYFKMVVIHDGLCGLISTTTEELIDTDNTWTTINYWPGGIIPYLLPDTMYDKSESGLIISAMKRWEYKTCLKFTPWTDSLFEDLGEIRYINFFSAGSCFSRAGMEDNQPQLFGIGKSCIKMPIILHELGHTIGLVHEMERVDRDMYIDILYENMNAASRRNFATTDSKKNIYPLFNTPYDYKSIMHYGPKAWSKNKKPVVVTRDPAYQHVIGHATDVSFFDALYVNRAYNCIGRCSRALQYVCQNGGFLGGPDCRCICQDGYMGEFCDTPIPGNEHILEWKCQKGWTYNDGKCYLFNTDSIVSFSRAKIACRMAKATLVILKDRSEQAWLNHMVRETKLITGIASFWIGLTKAAGVPVPTWVDGTFVDRNLISLVQGATSNQTECALFDGETATLTACTSLSGYICQKGFDAACGGRYVISEDSTVIQSPGYPDSYPDDMQCTYVLQTDEDAVISVSFEDFQLDANEKDYLNVQLQNDVAQEGTRYVGSSLASMQLVSEGNLVILELKSDARIAGMGFKATVTQIRKEKKKEQVLPIMTSIWDVFGWEGDAHASDTTERMWNLGALYDLLKSMTFSKVLK